MGNRAEFGSINGFEAKGELEAVRAFVEEAMALLGEDFYLDDGDDLDEPGAIEDHFNVFVCYDNECDGCAKDVRKELTAIGERHGLTRLELSVYWHWSDGCFEGETLIGD